MENNENIKIAAAVPGDGEGIASVHKNTWLVTYPDDTLGFTKEDILSVAKNFDDAQHIKDWEQKISANGKNDYYVCVAKDRGRVVAFCCAKIFENYNQFSALYILPGYQKQGIGKRLISEVFIWLSRNKKIIVTPVEYNLPAINFYKKIGFKIVEGKQSGKEIFGGKIMPLIEMELSPAPEKKFLITDIDGTVFDRIPLFCRVFVGLMEREGVPPQAARDFYYGSQGKPISDQVGQTLDRFGAGAPAKVDRIVKDFWSQTFSFDFNLFPCAARALAGAKVKGLGLLASSGSKTSEIETHIEKFGLPYDLVLGGDKIAKGDGHIKFFAARLGLEAEEFCRRTVFVGDGTVDMEIAARNGILAVGITNTLPSQKLIDAGAAATIENLDEILRFF